MSMADDGGPEPGPEVAFDEFMEKQKAILREAGLGADGKGDWHNLARTGGLSRIDPNYLQAFGFSQIGGEPFTLEHGLREHLVRFVAKMKSDYNGAYQSLPESHKQIIQGLVKSLKSSKDQGREWDLQQKLDDPTSFLELYQRALAASSGLWEVVTDTARHAGLPVAEDRSASPSVSWNVKLFSGRIKAKAAMFSVKKKPGPDGEEWIRLILDARRALKEAIAAQARGIAAQARGREVQAHLLEVQGEGEGDNNQESNDQNPGQQNASGGQGNDNQDSAGQDSANNNGENQNPRPGEQQQPSENGENSQDNAGEPQPEDGSQEQQRNAQAGPDGPSGERQSGATRTCQAQYCCR